MRDTLQLHLFGSPQITYRDEPVTGFVSNKVRALLFYLAVTARAHSRDALAELFWADRPGTQRANLKKALSNLRNREGVVLREAGQQSAALDLDRCWVDVAAFARLAEEAAPGDVDALQRAVDLYQGDFLAGFNTSLSYEFEAWALGERTRLQEQMIALLERLADAHAQRNELPAAIATVRRLLQIEPWREAAHRRLMALLARSGDRSAAMAQFEQCVHILRTELDVDPTTETHSLYEQIRAGAYPPSETDVSPPSLHAKLPTPTTRLVGRRSVLAQIAALLRRDEVRLVTLTGTGGVGKTRLAIQTGHELAGAFVDGVAFVELAPIRAPTLVPVSIADALGVREGAGSRPMLPYMVDYLRDKNMLLIIDNFEHVIASAPVVSALLAGAPNLCVLVTSREVLHVRGEFEFVVPPLTVPDQGQLARQSDSDGSEAVQLFVQQARALQPDFALHEGNRTDVAHICTRLDGLPLAIELAAARVKVLGTEAIAARIEQRFGFLQRGPRDAPARHQTLQSAIDWSYDLLTDEEQALFCQIAVFVGGCTLEAVDAVRTTLGASGDTLELMAALVDKSLVLRQQQDGTVARFTQLETIIEYGQHKLRALGEIDAVCAAHARFFLHLAEEAEPMLFGAEQSVWLARLEREHDNLRAALHWLIEMGDTAAAVRLGFALWHFWYIRSHHLEGRAWLEMLLAVDVSTAERAKLLYGLGMLARRTFDDATVTLRLTEALALFRQVEDEYYIASTLRVLGFTDHRAGDMDAAQQKLDEALALFRALNHTEGIAVTLTNIGYIHLREQRFATARTFLEESLAMRRQTGNQHGIANCLDSLALVAMHLRNYEEAKTLLVESLHIYETLGNSLAINVPNTLLASIDYIEGRYAEADVRFGQAYVRAKEHKSEEQTSLHRIHWSLTQLRLGNLDRAIELVCEALRYFRKFGPQERIVLGLVACSLAALSAGHIQCGLQSAATVLYIHAPARGHSLYTTIVQELEEAVAAVRPQLDPDEFDALWAEGTAMSLDQAVAAVLAVLESD